MISFKYYITFIDIHNFLLSTKTGHGPNFDYTRDL